ncbi:Hpt domain-containing protein [Granulicella cerasi]|uniref:Hpt domain-containing protein n=1 Tax=Granulicella cerasi TaxID=741063 RepID=A0ABW1Z6A4_9BACT|nr:Hpt domain-containing protein [Granulicella cerasi]
MSELTKKTSAAAQSAALLAALWQRNLPRVRERIQELHDAVMAASIGVLETVQRESAASTAHKLAGSLGMFGYHDGTDAARRLELTLEAEGELDIVALEDSFDALCRSLPL